MDATDTDILIIGAGLSGLSLAHRLIADGRDVVVAEARSRIGGRVLSEGPRALDLGPSWFWPGQPQMAGLVRNMKLDVFEQYAEGSLVFQDPSGAVRRDIEMAPMAGSLRIAGGMAAVTEGLARLLPGQALWLGYKLARLEDNGSAVIAHLTSADGQQIVKARTVGLAIPPRVAAESIEFQPALSAVATRAMQQVPTWMAGHAKVVAVYRRPFWREAGLSGDAISHLGPLAEIHDASPMDGSCGALFGFAGLLAPARRALGEVAFRERICQQLSALFGEDAAMPDEILIRDWADDPLTATALDDDPPPGHPTYGLPQSLRDLWGGKLHLASTETAEQFGGYLEGALEAAEQAFGLLSR